LIILTTITFGKLK